MMHEITVQELQEKKLAHSPLILVDVREPHENEEYNIGGVNIPLSELPFRIEELKALGDGEIVLYCNSGSRSILAQKLLATQFKIDNACSLVGGVHTWKEVYPE